VHDAMLNTDGSVKAEIFIQDKLHMNAEGYKIWTKIMKPELSN
jgi:lysophospholipase L1-like esterase